MLEYNDIYSRYLRNDIIIILLYYYIARKGESKL